MQHLEGVPAPAKLNLFLHVTGRRADGYHLLQSVFMLIDWMDTLDFELRTDGRISREDTVSGLPAEDLCVRAARALREATGTGLGVHIRLHKQIPAEAGMGGGSSDAATCLLALNRLWGLGLTRSALSRIGLALGADVPFFLGGHNAWVEGVGEKLTPVSLPSARFVVVKPPTGASTPAIFSSSELQRDTKTAILQGFAANTNAETLKSGVPIACDLRKILAFGHNDLQPVAQTLCPDVVRCLKWLSARGLHGRMTGSGTAVFAQLPQAADLSGAPADWVVRECGNMDAHPLLDWCPG
ncbi:4-(cytidine 5'-diphospho)-2-C-methyl-D-erythritol kinase [Hydrogenophaga pseudoflava]|uniref:4-(cytidine 5'-diphospho)-2-C-methyl-D-erythritol kinase n=1 Tax=Hydrogenophaga pseudoflava TaxID=47421 RepID=UPI0027E5038B|nr:4-(cytidine 5'-diphospho)-2-C-methyl-D-erythritol kinase [Hydrogenophaga pseudoflava]MDQ7746747.1 4-(cytidine 5'-diphospho)-2-C-methyl-D-erythritol kinase [Hydrogenophaga pseudoflava]